MKMLSAVTAVSVGHCARRSVWPAGLFLALVPAVIPQVVDGQLRMVSPIRGFDLDSEIDAYNGHGEFEANVEDQEADDWEVITRAERDAMAAAPVAAKSGALDLDPGSPAAQTDAQPENAGSEPTAAAGAQGAEQDGVSLPASGAPAAAEDPAPVQEVMQDSSTAAAPGGVQES